MSHHHHNYDGTQTPGVTQGTCIQGCIHPHPLYPKVNPNPCVKDHSKNPRQSTLREWLNAWDNTDSEKHPPDPYTITPEWLNGHGGTMPIDEKRPVTK